MLKRLLNSLVIRRVEFLVAEIPILLLPVLLVTHGAFWRQPTFWEGVLLFFMLFNVGDMVNCLADRELDARYKSHLSKAVYELGLHNVTTQIAMTGALAVALGLRLSLELNQGLIAVLVVTGLSLGFAYSVKPVHFKSRGLLQVACLWTIVFMGPMWLMALVVDGHLPWLAALLCGSFGCVQMGIILWNTAEDYVEDREAGLVTTTVRMGLQGGIMLAVWMMLAGSVGLIATMALSKGLMSARWLAGLLLILVTGAYRSAIQVRRLDLAAAVTLVKARAPAVPLALTLVAWSTLLWAW